VCGGRKLGSPSLGQTWRRVIARTHTPAFRERSERLSNSTATLLNAPKFSSPTLEFDSDQIVVTYFPKYLLITIPFFLKSKYSNSHGDGIERGAQAGPRHTHSTHYTHTHTHTQMAASTRRVGSRVDP
jgi:hypothetical protein